MCAQRSAQGKLAPSCATCTHFRSDPQELENAIAGLRSFGSGFAAVRADDGLCLLHARYLSANAHCARYSPTTGTTESTRSRPG